MFSFQVPVKGKKEKNYARNNCIKENGIQSLGTSDTDFRFAAGQSVNGRLQPGRKLKTIYLLPGALSHSEAVLTEMNLASYFEGVDLADAAIFCVTPTFSYYVDYQKEYRYAHQYFTFMTRELIEQTRTLFPLSDKKRGYGDLRAAP